MNKLDPQVRRKLYDYLYNEGHTPALVYECFHEDMPYGTAKARDGDPDNWLADNWAMVKETLEELYGKDLAEEAYERHEEAAEARLKGN